MSDWAEPLSVWVMGLQHARAYASNPKTRLVAVCDKYIEKARAAADELHVPMATHGYRTELWTTLRIAELIRRHMGIVYHRNHVGKLLHELGWSPQKPERRAIERDEEAIARWKRTVWPRVKKTPRGWGPISVSSTNRAFS